MERKPLRMFVILVLVLAAAALGCSALSGAPSIPGVTDATSPEPKPLLEDDFSSSGSGWGTGTDSDSGVEYEDGTLRMTALREYYFTWSTPDDEDYKNVHLEVTANNESDETLVGFGILCNQQVIDSSFHYFALTTEGEYAIAKAHIGEDDVFLTNDDEWATSDLIPSGAASYRIGADCREGQLTLYVNGQEIETVSDSSYTEGGVGLFLWSGEEPSGTISFDDFVMTTLE